MAKKVGSGLKSRKEPLALRRPARLSHVGPDGEARMVDVTDKPASVREAVASGRVTMTAAAVRAVRSRRLKKGDALQAARLAGILAAKRTANLIPLCHPLPLTGIDVELLPRPDRYDIRARVKTTAPTGVEMEALTAVAVAALTIYDMVKAVDKTMVIGEIALVEKTGGRSGTYRRRMQRSR